MANREQRYEDNAAGGFYVDEECICCSLCNEIAPDLFQESGEGGHHIVYRQPADPDSIALAHEALVACPVEAIGGDGARESSG
jgi:ferredoxin